MEDTKKTEFLSVARKRYAECLEKQAEMRRLAEEDLRFARLGDQWTDKDKEIRANRPTLTFNKQNTFCNYVVNEIKQNRSKPKARPVDDKADIETANVKTAIIDNIYANRGEGAVDTAMDYAVCGGLGFFRVATEYEGETFNQDLVLKRISNPFRVIIPFHECEEEDYSDMPYAFIHTKRNRKEFEEKHKNIDIREWTSLGEDLSRWLSQDEITVSEYWVVEHEPVELQDGDKKRTHQRKKIKQYLVVANEILEEKEWLGSTIPIIAITGQPVDINGELSFISLTRYSKDPQKFFNYARSSQAECMGMAPKAPWVIAEGQVKGHENEWKHANTTPVAYLTYKPETVGGIIVPPPSRTPSVQLQTELITAAREADEDMKEANGVWAANLGGAGNEVSGRAINARARQGSTSNFHFYDNTNKALEYLGKIILELIPVYYDTPRTVRIMGEDKKEEIIRVNEEYERNGKMVKYDMTTGKYDIVMDSSPAYASRRQEAEETIGNLIRFLPPAMGAAISDLYVRAMDTPYSMQMADRLKRMIPPEALKDEKEGSVNPAILKQIEMAMQQKDQMIKALDITIQKLTKELDDKSKDRELKIDTAILNSETQIEIARIKSAMDEMKNNQQLLLAQMKHMGQADTDSNITDTETGESVSETNAPPAAADAGQNNME